MTRTQDNNEPAFKRKQIFVKLVPRNQASDAINDIIFLSKQRRAPSGYTLVPGYDLCTPLSVRQAGQGSYH